MECAHFNIFLDYRRVKLRKQMGPLRTQVLNAICWHIHFVFEARAMYPASASFSVTIPNKELFGRALCRVPVVVMSKYIVGSRHCQGSGRVWLCYLNTLVDKHDSSTPLSWTTKFFTTMQSASFIACGLALRRVAISMLEKCQAALVSSTVILAWLLEAVMFDDKDLAFVRAID